MLFNRHNRREVRREERRKARERRKERKPLLERIGTNVAMGVLAKIWPYLLVAGVAIVSWWLKR